MKRSSSASSLHAISTLTTLLISTILMAEAELPQPDDWYKGDKKCQPPANRNAYSAPYNPLEHYNDFPTFPGADKPGWFCSYQRSDGVIVQYGDSRTPQEQWFGVWGNNNSEHD